MNEPDEMEIALVDVDESGVVALNPIQREIWSAAEAQTLGDHRLCVSFPAGTDLSGLRTAFRQQFENHKSLRTVFQLPPEGGLPLGRVVGVNEAFVWEEVEADESEQVGPKLPGEGIDALLHRPPCRFTALGSGTSDPQLHISASPLSLDVASLFRLIEDVWRSLSQASTGVATETSKVTVRRSGLKTPRVPQLVDGRDVRACINFAMTQELSDPDPTTHLRASVLTVLNETFDSAPVDFCMAPSPSEIGIGAFAAMRFKKTPAGEDPSACDFEATSISQVWVRQWPEPLMENRVILQEYSPARTSRRSIEIVTVGPDCHVAVGLPDVDVQLIAPERLARRVEYVATRDAFSSDVAFDD